MPVIALAQHIAEKVHAYAATYGPQEQHSTRIKDLIDILPIADLASPHADRLHASLNTTFSRRERQPLPAALPPPPAAWGNPYARAAADLGLPTDLGTAHAEAVTFLDPILAGTTTGRWNTTHKRWTAS
jgi:Nucleotidyl transferase AbiEii toxin, Type IV TA system